LCRCGVCVGVVLWGCGVREKSRVSVGVNGGSMFRWYQLETIATLCICGLLITLTVWKITLGEVHKEENINLTILLNDQIKNPVKMRRWENCLKFSTCWGSDSTDGRLLVEV
jgi:hypothetical protein